jgi:putative lipoprotein
MFGFRDALVGVVAVAVVAAMAQPSRMSASAANVAAAATRDQAAQDANAAIRELFRKVAQLNRERPAPLDQAALVKMLDEALAETGGSSSARAAAAGKVTGTVGYRERIMLPPSAVVKVQLVDVSRADAPATVLGEQTFDIGDKGSPYAFEITFDPAKIEANHTYAVQARIEVGGKLRFISDQRYAVITRGAPTKVDILVKGVSGQTPR